MSRSNGGGGREANPKVCASIIGAPQTVTHFFNPSIVHEAISQVTAVIYVWCNVRQSARLFLGYGRRSHAVIDRLPLLTVDGAVRVNALQRKSKKKPEDGPSRPPAVAAALGRLLKGGLLQAVCPFQTFHGHSSAEAGGFHGAHGFGLR